jgi:hypothetical protein
MWTPSRKLMNDFMILMTGDASISQGGTLKGALVGLLKQAIAYTPDSADSIVTSGEANYSGYARQAISAWTGPFRGQNGFSLDAGNAMVWEPSATTTLNTIYGQFLIGSDSVAILAVELFDNPIPLGDVSVGFVGTPIFGVGPNLAGYGNSIVSM